MSAVPGAVQGRAQAPTPTPTRTPTPTQARPRAGRRRIGPGGWLAAYLLAVVAVTCVHAVEVLALLALAAVAAAGPGRGRLLRRTLWTVLAFNLSVSAGLVLVAAWQGRAWGEALALINLRVLLLVFLGHWFVARVNLLQALARWPTLARVATVAASQAAVFARTLRDFRAAFRSRNPVPARPVDQARHAAAQVLHLLDKAEAAAGESAQALRSRGCFDD